MQKVLTFDELSKTKEFQKSKNISYTKNILYLYDTNNEVETDDSESGGSYYKNVIEELEKMGYNVYAIKIDPDEINIQSYINSIKPEVVFNMVENMRKDRYSPYMPLMLEYYQIPYTGVNYSAYSYSVNKTLWKKVLNFYNIPTPQFVDYTAISMEQKIKPAKYILKLKDGSGSGGISEKSIYEFSNIDEATCKIKKSPDLYLEEFITGREIRCSTFGNAKKYTILPPHENELPKSGILTRAAKYDKENEDYKNCGLVKLEDKKLAKQLVDTTEKIWKVLEVKKGYLDVDYRVDKQGNFYAIDINANPDISPLTSIHTAVTAAGIEFKDFLQTIIDNAKIKC